MYHKFKQYPNSLRKHRKNVGLTQREIAELLGLKTAERLSRWENGSAKPMPGTLFKLAGIYHVSPQELLSEFWEAGWVKASPPDIQDTVLVSLDDGASYADTPIPH
jgi:transcriptional regulator with XRE-family HTH domain